MRERPAFAYHEKAHFSPATKTLDSKRRKNQPLPQVDFDLLAKGKTYREVIDSGIKKLYKRREKISADEYRSLRRAMFASLKEEATNYLSGQELENFCDQVNMIFGWELMLSRSFGEQINIRAQKREDTYTKRELQEVSNIQLLSAEWLQDTALWVLERQKTPGGEKEIASVVDYLKFATQNDTLPARVEKHQWQSVYNGLSGFIATARAFDDPRRNLDAIIPTPELDAQHGVDLIVSCGDKDRKLMKELNKFISQKNLTACPPELARHFNLLQIKVDNRFKNIARVGLSAEGRMDQSAFKKSATEQNRLQPQDLHDLSRTCQQTGIGGQYLVLPSYMLDERPQRFGRLDNLHEALLNDVSSDVKSEMISSFADKEDRV